MRSRAVRTGYGVSCALPSAGVGWGTGAGASSPAGPRTCQGRSALNASAAANHELVREGLLIAGPAVPEPDCTWTQPYLNPVTGALTAEAPAHPPDEHHRLAVPVLGRLRRTRSTVLRCIDPVDSIVHRRSILVRTEPRAGPTIRTVPLTRLPCGPSGRRTPSCAPSSRPVPIGVATASAATNRHRRRSQPPARAVQAVGT